MTVKTEYGPLELRILQIMWELESATTREILNVLTQERDIALTTVSTTLDRLHKKKLLSRRIKRGKGGIFYRYRVKITKDEFELRISQDLSTQLTETYGDTAAKETVKEIAQKISKKDLTDLIRDLKKIKREKP
ncbi:MAG: BlaI/MecI/CopY family transcriptional regulator [Candidatus Heimdallarchaeota archaeon]|nr:BlaI/MecI/CopY family transcriptional regulator [Candidatus Heimdallarchaeota archaeon]